MKVALDRLVDRELARTSRLQDGPDSRGERYAEAYLWHSCSVPSSSSGRQRTA
jgi:hypothetical protein